MTGGAGNDTYTVNSAGDVVYESASQGYDRINASLTFNLASKGANVEQLTLTGSKAIDGTGNGLNNVLAGNGSGNKLWGNNGNDKLIGNGGNDSLYGGNGNDILLGGTGNDLLAGGAGKDQLTGGGGADRFVFDTALNPNGNLDVITDFNSGTDKIWLDDDIFKALGPVSSSTALASAGFYKAAGASSAHDADDRIIYDTSTGALYFDADGLGGTAAVKFAVLGTSTHPGLAASDLFVVM